MMTPVIRSAEAPGPKDFANIFGPVFWGFCAALILTGVTCLQGYLYFTRYNDKLPVKLVAVMMLMLDFTSMGLILQSIYYYMLPDFGSLEPLTKVTAELNIECLIAAIITFTSQMYFAVQLYYVKGRGGFGMVITAIVALFAFIALVGGVGCVATMFIYPHSVFMNRNHTFAIFAGINKAFASATDIVATIAMCIFLKSADTGMRGTSTVLYKLMIYVINRGVLVTLSQVLLLVVFFSHPTHLYWLAFHVNTTKLYVNTFFAMLNARNSLKESSQSRVSVSVDSSYFNTASGNGIGTRSRGRYGNGTFPNSPMSPKFAEQKADPELDLPLDTIRITKSTSVAQM